MTKYYVPQIEEFHIGFEFEYLRGKPEFWEKQTFGLHRSLSDINKDVNHFRVKYLDVEDIKSLNWYSDDAEDEEEILSKDDFDFETFYYEDPDGVEYMLTLHDDQQVVIQCNVDGEVYFYGKIKNKSELKRIMKQVM